MPHPMLNIENMTSKRLLLWALLYKWTFVINAGFPDENKWQIYINAKLITWHGEL